MNVFISQNATILSSGGTAPGLTLKAADFKAIMDATEGSEDVKAAAAREAARAQLATYLGPDWIQVYRGLDVRPNGLVILTLVVS